jgi:predicted ATPase/DNA-binding CsgD family transcriptional regulator
MSKAAASGHEAAEATATLPRHLTRFVGRDTELRSLKAALGSSRLLTLTGPGGAGKTRLAIEVARASSELWPDGVWWIPLEAADDAPGAVVAALDLRGAGRGVDVITSWLAARRALLILDNCEHVIAASAQLGQALLERCPTLSILATSREPLGIAGEVRWPVSSLDDADAFQLFEARAQLVLPAFKVAPHNRQSVAAICRQLDRLPLAIEMAAARLDIMSEPELLANLSDRLGLLKSDVRTAPDRQQTMAATIDWSHRLLTERERRLFRRLAVFQGAFTMEGAQAVCADDSRTALSLLSALVRKSMVVAERSSDGGTRYRLLESHRAYANEQLRESGELSDVQRRHYEYVRTRKWAPIDSADFWHAVAWARENADDGGLDLALEVANSDFSQQARAFGLILDLLEGSSADGALRARATIMAMRLAWRLGDEATGKALADSAVSLARKVGDQELVAQALNGAGLVHETWGDKARAIALYDEAIALLSDPRHRALAIEFNNGRALLAIAEGDAHRAHEILVECVAYARLQNDGALVARYLESLANAQLDLGEVDRAATSWMDSLSAFRANNDWFGTICCLIGLALVAAKRREDDRALKLAAATNRLSREYSLAIWSYRAAQLDTACKTARTRLGQKGRADAAWSEGLTMTIQEALDYALGSQPAAIGSASIAGPLSRREHEVAAMIASGMTNKQIAQRLFIAERTAEGHVERIRNKLGVRSRTEVATWAVTHGMGPAPLDKPTHVSKV